MKSLGNYGLVWPALTMNSTLLNSFIIGPGFPYKIMDVDPQTSTQILSVLKINLYLHADWLLSQRGHTEVCMTFALHTLMHFCLAWGD